MLAQAGHKVTLIARPHHAEAIVSRGLILERRGKWSHLPAQSSVDPATMSSGSLILFCGKSNDTQTAGAGTAPHVRPEAQILSLQNGVDNATRLAEQLGRDVKPAVVYVAAAMAGAWHVRHHGRGELVLGQHTADIWNGLAWRGGIYSCVPNTACSLWAFDFAVELRHRYADRSFPLLMTRLAVSRFGDGIMLVEARQFLPH